MAKTNPPAENLGVVPIGSGVSSAGKMYGGGYNEKGKFVPNGIGEMRREVDPDGRITTHPVRISPYVHERLHSLGKLAHELYDAAEKFRIDFERAQLCGNYARLDMFKARSGRQEMSDGVMRAKIRINKALEALGRGKDGPNLLQSCSWSVVGLGMNLENWTNMLRQAGSAMNADKASGVFHSCLELLALQYGMMDTNRLVALRQDSAFGRGVKAAREFLVTCPPRSDEAALAYAKRLNDSLGKGFAKYLA